MKETTKYNGLWMVVSVILAIMVWSYVGNVANRDESGVIRNIPVTFVGLETLESRGLMITDGLNQTVTLNVTGKRDAFRQLSAETVSVTVDVSSVQQTGRFTQAYRISYNLPPSVSANSLLVTDQYPLNVTYTVSRLETRSIPVQGRVTGSVAEGYQLGEFIFSPEHIVVKGEASIVNQIECALVTLSQENMSAAFTGELPYTFISYVGEPMDMTGLEVDQTLVRTTLPIIRLKEVDLAVNLIPGGGITAEMIKDYVTCEITPESIMVSGAENDLEGLKKLSLGNIDLAKVFGDETRTFTIPLAAELTNVSGVSEATVTISIHGLATATIESTNIELINKPEGYRAEALTQTRQIQIRGTKEAVEAVTSEQIRIVGDLQNATISTGTQTIPAKIQLNSGSNVGVLGEYTIVVSISRE